MPQCVDCGAETPRDEMYGAPDELRCRACAHKSYQPFTAPRHPVSKLLPPVVTYAAIAGAVVCFLLSQSPQTRPWIYKHIVVGPMAVWDGQPWRLVTSVFPHANLIHLLFNLYWLWRFGRDIEEWMGPLRYAGFFVLLAAGSSAAQLQVSIGGIGFSGVVYGMFGLLYALRRNKDFAALHMQPQVVQLFVAWFFLCIVLTHLNVMRIGNMAHGSGAVLGWLIGQAILSRWRAWLVPLVGLGIVLFSLTPVYMPWNGYYALDRGNRCLQRQDPEGALYWYRWAERTLPEHPGLREMVRGLELRERDGDHEE
jgi:membrane associated rhomboid family serine protease